MTDDKKTIIQKTGTTDLRRSGNALKIVIAEKMKLPINENNIYAFANKTQTIMKAVNYNENQTTMVTIKTAQQFPWPAYDKSYKTLTKQEAKEFNKTFGLI